MLAWFLAPSTDPLSGALVEGSWVGWFHRILTTIYWGWSNLLIDSYWIFTQCFIRRLVGVMLIYAHEWDDVCVWWAGIYSVTLCRLYLHIMCLILCQVTPTRVTSEKMTWCDSKSLVHIRIHWKRIDVFHSVDVSSLLTWPLFFQISPTCKCSPPKKKKNIINILVWVLRCFDIGFFNLWHFPIFTFLVFGGFFCVSKEVLKRGEARLPRLRLVVSLRLVTNLILRIKKRAFGDKW